MNLDRQMQEEDIKAGTSKGIKYETKPIFSMPMPMGFKVEEQQSNEENFSGAYELQTDEIEYKGEVPLIPVDQDQLLDNMREEHNLRFKTGVLMGVRADEGIRVSFFIFNILYKI